MDDLVQWLTAQLDEDQLLAERGILKSVLPPDFEGLTREGMVNLPGPVKARVLREIEAKRKLLALLPDLAHADRMIEGEWGSSDDLAEKLLDALLTPYPKCGATTVFWPEDEACDAVCVWPRGHGGVRHIDETLGEWDEEELATSHPSE